MDLFKAGQPEEQNVTARRFPPWSVEETGACFIVTDNAGRKPTYIYSEDEPGRRSAAKLLKLPTSDGGSRQRRADAVNPILSIL